MAAMYLRKPGEGIGFTLSKLLQAKQRLRTDDSQKSSALLLQGEECFGSSFLLFLSFPQGSLNVHSFCTTNRGFSVAVDKILAQSGFHQKRWNSQACETIDCGDAGGSRQFSRVNCRGKSEARASACRLPGHCGLLHFLLFEQVGLLATAGRCAPMILKNLRHCRPVLVKVALPVSAVGLVPSSLRCKRWEGRMRDPRTVRREVAGFAPHLFGAEHGVSTKSIAEERDLCKFLAGSGCLRAGVGIGGACNQSCGGWFGSERILQAQESFLEKFPR